MNSAVQLMCWSSKAVWICCFVQLWDLRAAQETAVIADNSSHIIKDNPQLWGNLPHLHWEQSRKKKKRSIGEQMSPSRVWSTGIKATAEEEEREEMKATPPTLLPLTPGHLLSRLPTKRSPLSGSRQLFPSSPIDPFQHRCIKRHAASAALPPRLSKEMMNMKKLFTGVCEGGNFHHAHVRFPVLRNNNPLMFLLTQPQ